MRLTNAGEVTDGGYFLECAAFCTECALEVTQDGKRLVWRCFVCGCIHDAGESLDPACQAYAKSFLVNAVTYPEYAEVSFIDWFGETDSPCHCDSCGILIRENLTTDGGEYVKEYCRKSRSKITRLYRQEFDYLFTR